MANILKRAIRIFNGKDWDKYHPETSADQVVYTKADGTASNVQKELDAQNSALNGLLPTDGSVGSALRFHKFDGNLTYGCYGTGCYIYPGYSTGAPDDWGGLLVTYKTAEGLAKYALTRGGNIYHMLHKSDGQVDQSWTKLCGKY